jgi:hypothetical protein
VEVGIAEGHRTAVMGMLKKRKKKRKGHLQGVSGAQRQS